MNATWTLRKQKKNPVFSVRKRTQSTRLVKGGGGVGGGGGGCSVLRRDENGLIKIPSNRHTRWGGRTAEINPINQQAYCPNIGSAPHYRSKSGRNVCAGLRFSEQRCRQSHRCRFCRLADISLTQLMVVGCKVINKRSERSARPVNSNTSYYTPHSVLSPHGRTSRITCELSRPSKPKPQNRHVLYETCRRHTRLLYPLSCNIFFSIFAFVPRRRG